MYIKDFEIIGEMGYANHRIPRANLYIADCSVSDLDDIKKFTQLGGPIIITNREALTTLIKPPKYYCTPISKYTDIKVIKVIYHNPATIVFWSDGTKTVVKCGKDDTYDKEKGFYIACTKKFFGNDYRAVGRINKALAMAEDKND